MLRKCNALSIVGVAFVLFVFASASANAFAAYPDLAVFVFGAGTDPRPIVAPGQDVQFSVAVGNINGDGDAHHVRVSALLPKGLKFGSANLTPTRIENSNRLVWEIGDIPAKALPRIFEVTAQAESDLAPGSQLILSAEASSSEANANPADNHFSYTFYVQPPGPDLAIVDSTVDSVPLNPDGPATFEMGVMNAGNLPATDVWLEANLPNEVQFEKGDPPAEPSTSQKLTFKLGDLARGQSRQVAMTIALDAKQVPAVLRSDRGLTFSFAASRSASSARVTDIQTEAAKRIQYAGQDVALWLTTEGAKEPGEVSPKDQVTCVIMYANLGSEAAHKVVVTMSLGSGLAIAHSAPQPSANVSNVAYPGGVARWDIGDLGVGISGTIRSVIHVTSVPDDGALVNATITADGADIDSSNNTASLLWHSPLPPGTLKSMRRTSAVEPVGGSEGAGVRPVSHRLRHLFELIVLIVVVLIIVRARRNA